MVLSLLLCQSSYESHKENGNSPFPGLVQRWRDQRNLIRRTATEHVVHSQVVQNFRESHKENGNTGRAVRYVLYDFLESHKENGNLPTCGHLRQCSTALNLIRRTATIALSITSFCPFLKNLIRRTATLPCNSPTTLSIVLNLIRRTATLLAL